MSPIAISSLEEQYISPIATAELVGRRKEREQIERAIRDTSRQYVIYITGRGGIGKTRLLQHVLKNPPPDLPLLVASRPIDMYHTYCHTLEGFLHAVQEVLDPEGVLFQDYLQARRKLSGAAGTATWRQRRDEMIEAFFKDLETVTSGRRILLAIDTVERLFPGDDPAATRLEISTARSLVYNWLVGEFLPRVKNIVVILAGRPEAKILAEDFQKSGCFAQISLSGLMEDESLEYFDALTTALEATGQHRDHFVADHIRQWDENFRRMLFQGLRDEDGTVRPILLALTIDYLAISGQPFFSGRTLDEVRSFSSAQREAVKKDLLSLVEQAIAETLHPAGEAIRVMGWLRKGADEDLLARLTGLDISTVSRVCEQLRTLSFVKTRPADRRIFLHDEMYALLQDPRDALPYGIFRPLQEYYKKHIESAQGEIAGLYTSAGDKRLAEAFLAAHRLRDTLAENLHYTLRWNAREGFLTYFRYAEEALALGDHILDMQLRAELMDFLRERDPDGQAGAIDGLSQAEILADAALRWVRRLIAAGQYPEAMKLIRRLRGSDAGLLNELGELARAELDITEAILHILQGKTSRGEKLLRKAENHLTRLTIQEEQALRVSALKGQLYNIWGYLRRVQGQFIAAAEMYWKALPYWRETKLEAEQANTLTNLAFALALQGKFHPARIQADDALSLRAKQGIPSRVALTLNTRAEIEIRAGQFGDAETYALQALQIAQRQEFPRGEGLAHLTLAACYRFMSEPPRSLSLRKRKQLLQKSLHHSQEAIRIFSKEVEEPERLASAYYEHGITHREFCRFQAADLGDHIQQAEECLQKSMEIASQNKLWAIYLDAAIGLAWLYHYADQEDTLSPHIQNTEAEIGERFPAYCITPTHFPKVKDSMILGIFQQLARLHVLKGVRVMEAFRRERAPSYDLLKTAAREFALALEYDYLVAEDFRDLRRALNLIHAQLKGLNTRELKTVYDAVSEMHGEFPHKRRREEWRLWQTLENLFGPYEVLAGWSKRA